MTNPALEQRIREKLGSSINVDYVESLLAQSQLQILEWMQMDMGRIIDITLPETRHHFSQDTICKDTVNFGLKHLQFRLKLLAFLAEDLQQKFNAVDIEKPSAKLPE